MILELIAAGAVGCAVGFSAAIAMCKRRLDSQAQVIQEYGNRLAELTGRPES